MNLAKSHNLKTLKSKRFLLDIFIEQFGHLELKELTIPMVMKFLMTDNHSGSWKNNFLTKLCGQI